MSQGRGIVISAWSITYFNLEISYKAMQKKFSGSQIIDLKNMGR